jgi:hypothetical protein
LVHALHVRFDASCSALKAASEPAGGCTGSDEIARPIVKNGREDCAGCDANGGACYRADRRTDGRGLACVFVTFRVLFAFRLVARDGDTVLAARWGRHDTLGRRGTADDEHEHNQ